MTKPALKLAAFAAAASLVAAGCGGGSNSEGAYGGAETAAAEGTTSAGRSYGNAPQGGSAAAAGAGGAATVSVGSVPKLGRVLVDAQGFTLYEFEKDKGTSSTCYGECASTWPPLLSEGTPQPSNGAAPAKLGTSKRRDGTLQVTYAGRPLYTFVEDTKPGDAKGNNLDFFGGEWYALTPAGDQP